MQVIAIKYCKLSSLILLSDRKDYVRNFTVVTIAAGEISKSFSISIINDNIIECNEVFILCTSIINLLKC